LGAYHRSDKEEVEKDLNRIYTLFPRFARKKGTDCGKL